MFQLGLQARKADADSAAVQIDKSAMQFGKQRVHENRRRKLRIGQEFYLQIVIHGSILLGIAEHATTDQIRHHIVLLFKRRNLVLQHPAVEQCVKIGLLFGLAVRLALRRH